MQIIITSREIIKSAHHQSNFQRSEDTEQRISSKTSEIHQDNGYGSGIVGNEILNLVHLLSDSDQQSKRAMIQLESAQGWIAQPATWKG